jgi:hypothetical protein
MAKTSKFFGYMGLGGAVLVLAGVIAATLSFERGAYSPVSCFFTELGQYARGEYFSVSSALYFNVGLIAFGLTFGLLMIWRGTLGNTLLYAATGFTGALTGVLAAAQAIFTLNYTQYHYAIVSAFYFSAALFCTLQIIAWMREGKGERFGLALLVLFFAAGALCLASGVFTAMGGYSRVLLENTDYNVLRPLIVPFALVGWLAAAIIWVCGTLLSVSAALGVPKSASASRTAKPVRRYNDFAL